MILLALTAATALAAYGDDSAAMINSATYLRCVEKADSLVSAGDWEAAGTALKEALRAEPANPSNQLLLANMGMILTAQGKYGDAVRHLDAALALNPRSFLAYKHRGVAYSAMKRFDDAIADFTQALEIDSADNDVRCMRATIYACRNRMAEATADYTDILSRDKDNVKALEGMATCCLAEEKHDAALPYLNRLIELNPEPEHYFSRGLAYARLGRIPEATEDAAEGLLHDPACGNLWLLRAYIEKLTYRNNDAKTSLQKAHRYGADPELEQQLIPDL